MQATRTEVGKGVYDGYVVYGPYGSNERSHESFSCQPVYQLDRLRTDSAWAVTGPSCNNKQPSSSAPNKAHHHT